MRVLEEAENTAHPLLERVRFLSISGSNLDEFFMVRAAGLRALARKGITTPSQDGLSPTQQLKLISEHAGDLMDRQQELWRVLHRELRTQGVFVLSPEELTEDDRTWLRDDFMSRVFPLLTPLACDPAHPFPFISNLGFTLALTLRSGGKRMNALVPFPTGVNRFVALPDGEDTADGRPTKRFIAFEEVLAQSLDLLFPGYQVLELGAFRIVRDSEIEVDDESEDFVEVFEVALKRRRRGELVRLKIDASTPEPLRHFIAAELECPQDDVIIVDGMLGVKDLSQIITSDRSDLTFEGFEPRFPERIRDHGGDCFAAIRAKDILLHHPYETFDVVIQFLRQAAADPHVVTIKQTLYRTSEGSPIVKALCDAADAGKNVTALVELKARFDEEANIGFARDLERHGVQVVYGFLQYKTHAKLSLVVRREGDQLRTYTHVGTGNYHPLTARIYTDLALFTADPAFGRDAGRVFNYITGYAKPEHLERFALSPINMRTRLVELIDAEIANSRAGKPSGVWAKMNSLVHAEVIDALYRASAAGVPIELVVRGICCLRPGVPGLSDTIRVKSIVGRFLEHSRIFAVANGAAMPSSQNLVFISSADWMPRNLDRRVEVMAPLENATVHRQVLEQILIANVNDEAQSWYLNPEGDYRRVDAGSLADPFNAHGYFMEHPSLSGRGRLADADMPPQFERIGARA